MRPVLGDLGVLGGRVARPAQSWMGKSLYVRVSMGPWGIDVGKILCRDECFLVGLKS